jgi:hypothetical protein
MCYTTRLCSIAREAAAPRGLRLTAAVAMVGLLGNAPVLDAQ